MSLSKIDINKANRLITSQKTISSSFNSIKLSIDVFLKINKRIKEDIELSKGIDNNKHTHELLKNTVLVYELTGFVLDYISSFNLDGTKELADIKNEIFKEIEINRRKEHHLEMEINSESNQGSEDVKSNAIKAIKDRLTIYDMIESKWKEFYNKLNNINESIVQVKNIVPDLKIIQRNAERQIDVLQLIYTMQLLESNLNLLQGISSITKIELAPLTPEDACVLLGFDNFSIKKISN